MACQNLCFRSVKKKEEIQIFDEKTEARLKRERSNVLRGLLTLKKYERIRTEECSKLAQEKYEDKKEDKDYACTKLSILKRMLRLKIQSIQNERFKKCSQKKFVVSFMRLKNELLNQRLDYLCHLEERKKIREHDRSKFVNRLLEKYEIVDGSLPYDHPIFDQIITFKRNRKKEKFARKKRTIEIIEKISREMNGRCIKLIKRVRSVRSFDEEECPNIYFEKYIESREYKIQNKEKERTESITVLNKEITTIEKNNEISTKVEEKDLSTKSKEKVTSVEEALTVVHFEKKKHLRLDDEEFPIDNCFYANPDKIEFKDFQIGKTYCRKVCIFNKSSKWAYIRYHKIETKIWEPVIEVDMYSAAKLKPGLHVKINIKFLPIHEEEVIAMIHFLTFGPDNPTTYHRFSIPIHCLPEIPIPIIDPQEIRFVTLPIWKFTDSKLNEKILTISNEGKKLFTLLIENKDRRYNYFVWSFENGEIQSVESSDEDISMLFNEDRLIDDNENERKKNNRSFSMIDIPADFSCRLRIRFYPKYVGFHFENLQLRFQINKEIFDRRDVSMWAEATGLQIHLDPSYIDLGIVVMNFGIYQQNFNIINTGRLSIEVSMSIPRSLKNQIFLYPRSTLIQPESINTISVRFIPESNIIKKSRRYYNSISNVLEVPIHVKSMSADAINASPLILKVLSTLTTCHALILEPSHVELGRVFTHESVLAELTLTNVSLLVQEYGFVNLPSFMEIQPNYGFGKILPGESIPLHLIYSPFSIDIPGNELGVNGLEGERSFLVQVVTITELAGRGKELEIDKLKNPYVRKSKQFRMGSGLPFKTKIVDGNECRMLRKKNLKDLKKEFHRRCDITEDINDEYEQTSFKEENTSSAVSKLDRKMDKRVEKNVIKVSVYIVDTYCELSEQILEFPGTPCGCFSIISIELRAFNMASYPNCSCNVLKKDQSKEFTARYEFRCSSRQMSIVPASGRLRSNDLVVIKFIFEPKLSKYAVTKRTQELKASMIAKELETEKLTNIEKKSTRKEKLPAKTRRQKRSKDNEVEETDRTKKEKENLKISSNDLFLGECDLLENFEAYSTTIDVACSIEIETADGISREETLFAKLYCPVIKPAIIILNTTREISFEPTIIGSSSRKFLSVKNISDRGKSTGDFAQSIGTIFYATWENS
ncbi:hypothetical protein HZH68_000322 [Vespula germanica]|uniref:MSP domain-containing protein n=1 Tax=Vespula germanica TaxID=30212 RepID=A0A834NTW4_VESGE|nr:hypothetical protein HZH68_000322 [Vespula germanica]